MRALLVYAHPEPRSFNAAMRDTAVTTLAREGYEVDVSDLYAMRFKAALDQEDFGERLHQDVLNVPREQRHGMSTATLRADIHSEIEKLRAADLVVFQFPLWWFSMPAILKGWFDRVFVSGEVYGRSHLFERGKLRGKRAMLSVTTGAPEPSFGPDALNGDILEILMPIHRGTLGFTGMTVMPPFVAYGVPYVHAAQRTEVLGAYATHLRSLDALAPLRMPRLGDHIEALAEHMTAKAQP